MSASSCRCLEEDGDASYERWPDGDFKKSQAWEGVDAETKDSFKGQIIHYRDWVLTLPERAEALQIFPLPDSERIIVLTKDYRVCDWDLNVLSEELKMLGF